ncbi:MAG: mannose-1-phosphate guanylyltransferase/mannose-6-phosphate isomerase [Alphaproteobacteria bacterium]
MIITPVILSGGSGTRLWPVSRQRLPKQFVQLLDHDSTCLFALTLRSALGKPGFSNPVIVGNADHKFLILEILEQLSLKNTSILLEPMGRNTAAAAIVAALADADKVDVLHLVRPSDHIIANEKAFYDAVQKAAPVALQGHFVLFGIKPVYAETGFGYISPVAQSNNVENISAFHEKPDEKMALDLMAKGALWNSGIFLYPPKLLIQEAEKLAPDLLKQCREAVAKAEQDLGCTMLDKAAYQPMANEPFDRVIMEQTKLGKVVACDMGWNDVGSWQALWQLDEKDANANVCTGTVVTRDVKNSYIRSDGPAVAALDLDNIMVIATKDAVLVAPMSQSQNIKDLVADLRTTDENLTAEHPRVLRPWGSYEGIAHGQNFQVKQIIVKPGRSLSLQMHNRRAEHWVVVEGVAKVEVGDMEKMVHPNQAAYIPLGTKHRLSNPGTKDLHLIEVQCGDYLGEDDIVRYADNYGRKS